MTSAAAVVMTAWCLADGSGTGRTATGVVPLAGYTVAADWAVYAPGTVLLVLGLGVRVVEDRGSKVRGAQLDDYHGADAAACASAKAWGRQAREVLVLHRPAERNGSGKRETSEPGARRRESSAPRLLPVIEPGPGAVEAPRTGICERSPGCSGSIRGSEPIEARR